MRQLLDVLRDGYRLPRACHGERGREGRRLRGCGMFARVCPRGVLRLENTPSRWKAGQPIRVYVVDL
jgi:hypothetical protein